jgi:hypothetical protein
MSPLILEIEVRGRRAEVLVHSPMMRIGSDPACEVRVSADVLGPHPLTLEVRDGRCILHNHAAARAELHGRSVNLGCSVAWAPGHVIRLNNDVALRLKTRALRPQTTVAPAPPQPPPSQPGSGSGSRGRAWYMFMVTGILLLCGFYWSLDRATLTDDDVKAELQELVRTAHRQGHREAGDPYQSELCFAIQSARIATVRGDAATAAAILAAVRDALLQHRRSDGSFDGRWDAQCLDLVKKMEQIGTR